MPKTVHRNLTSFDGTRLHYEVTTVPKSSHTLLLIHGMGGSARAWDLVRNRLNRYGFSTIVPDLRGQGISGRPNERTAYHLDCFAKDLQLILQTEKPPNPVIVGHCLGGMVALAAELLPLKGRHHLILINTNSEAPTYAHHPLSKAIWKIVFPLMSRLPRVKTIDLAYSRFNAKTDFDPFRIVADALRTSLRDYFLICNAMLNFNVTSSLTRIKSPTLIIAGQKDSVFPPQVVKRMADQVPNASFHIMPGSHHVVVLDKPAQLAETIKKYLDTI